MRISVMRISAVGEVNSFIISLFVKNFIRVQQFVFICFIQVLNDYKLKKGFCCILQKL